MRILRVYAKEEGHEDNAYLNGLHDKRNFTEEDADPEQFKMGLEVEKEHTPDQAVAARITLDHLSEISDYYTRLKKMEEEADKEGMKS